MSAALQIEVGEICLPGLAHADGVEVATTFRTELAALWQADRNDGIDWTTRIDSLAIELDPGISNAELGRALASAVRRQALSSGDGR